MLTTGTCLGQNLNSVYTSINTIINANTSSMFKSFKTASITELRQNATSLVNGVNKSKEPVFILQNSKKAAVLIDDASFHKMMQAYVDAVDYQEDRKSTV